MRRDASALAPTTDPRRPGIAGRQEPGPPGGETRPATCASECWRRSASTPWSSWRPAARLTEFAAVTPSRCWRSPRRLEPQPRGSDSDVWLDRLQTEHDNMRAALGWSRRAAPEGTGVAPPDRAGLGLRLAASLWEFWHVRGHYTKVDVDRDGVGAILGPRRGSGPRRCRPGRLIYSRAIPRAGAEAEGLGALPRDRRHAFRGLGAVGIERRGAISGDYPSAEACSTESIDAVSRVRIVGRRLGL